MALKAGATSSVDELPTHVKAQVDAHKFPPRVWLVDALPPAGKILTREIAAPTEMRS